MSENFNRDEPRILEYRRQVKLAASALKYVAFFFFVLFIGAGVFCAAASYGGVRTPALQTLAIAIGAIALFVYLAYRILLKPVASNKIQVFKDRLLIRRGEKEITVPFSEINKIKSTAHYSLGGWFTLIMKNKKKHRFGLVLERADYIVDAIAAFDAKVLPPEDHSKLRTHLILADHALARIYDFFGRKYRWITASHAFFLPAAFAAFLISRQEGLMVIRHPILFYADTLSQAYFAIAAFGIIAICVINAVANKAAKMRLQKNPTNKIRDTALESAIYRKVFPAYLLALIGFFSVVYRYDLNTLSWSYTPTALSHLQQGSIWIDKRYNCVNCPYSLKVGDPILLRSLGQSFLGEVVGLPGDNAVVTDNFEGEDRHIASNETQAVPENKIAIRLGEHGSATMLVDIDYVVGRADDKLSSFIEK